jgi:large subunit ribosomal protein L3
MISGMIGRKIGMMRLYDGAGRVRAVTVMEVGPNRVTQLRTTERDGYEAVQLGFTGARKRLNRPERGHLRKSGVDEVLSVLQEFPLDGESFEQGQTVTVEAFTPGEYVNIEGVSKGKGWAGGIKRYHFRGGPKTHGQSDRHRAPGSVGSGTTPGKVWKGQKMAGHMGARTATVMNVLVVLTDPARNLLFIEGSVPGANEHVVTVTRGRRPALKNYTPPTLPALDEDEIEMPAPMMADEPADEVVADETEEAEATEAMAAAEGEAETPADETEGEAKA